VPSRLVEWPDRLLDTTTAAMTMTTTTTTTTIMMIIVVWLDASGVGAGVGKVPVWVASFDSAKPANNDPFSNFEFAASTVAAFAVQSSK